jgi:hypothetical protein
MPWSKVLTFDDPCTTGGDPCWGLARLSHEERTIPRRIDADNTEPALDAEF